MMSPQTENTFSWVVVYEHGVPAKARRREEKFPGPHDREGAEALGKTLVNALLGENRFVTIKTPPISPGRKN